MRSVPLLLLSLIPTLTVGQESAEASRTTGWEYKGTHLTVRLVPRAPEQVAAFYEARGFPVEMIELIKSRCFVTIGIHNTSKEVVWLDLERWRFVAESAEIRRFDRNWWKAQWQAIAAPLPSQSTFRWTLLPEVLDFRPDESEGGNVTLERTWEPFALEARFAIGTDRKGGDIEVRIDGLRCAEDPEP